MSNRDNSVLYIGVTDDLSRRVIEHKSHSDRGFTDRYNCVKLLYYEQFGDIGQAIAREKQLKGWRRAWKYELIRSVNPEMLDLCGE